MVMINNCEYDDNDDNHNNNKTSWYNNNNNDNVGDDNNQLSYSLPVWWSKWVMNKNGRTDRRMDSINASAIQPQKIVN